MKCQLCHQIDSSALFGNLKICVFCKIRLDKKRKNIVIGSRFEFGKSEMFSKKQANSMTRETDVYCMLEALERIHGDKFIERALMFLNKLKLTKKDICYDDSSFQALEDFYETTKNQIFEFKKMGYKIKIKRGEENNVKN